MKMKACVLYKQATPMRMEEVDIIEPRALEIRVKIKSAGICHTDIAHRDNEWNMPLGMPMILGHEGAGIVESVGPGVTKCKPGDKVILSNPSCGACEMCAKGEPWFCEQTSNLHLLTDGVDYYEGTHMTNSEGQGIYTLFNQGSFAEYVLAHERCVTKIDDNFDIRVAGPLGCGLRSGAGAVYNVLKPRPSDWVCITGCGAVGMSAMWMANAMGAKTLLLDINETRLEQAKELGAFATLNVKGLAPDEISAKIHEICDGKGAHYLVEGSGVASVIKPAMKGLRAGGVCAQIGMAGSLSYQHYTNDCNDTHAIQWVRMGNVDNDVILPVLIDLYKRGKFPCDKTYTYYPFDKIFDAMADASAAKINKAVLLFD